MEKSSNNQNIDIKFLVNLILRNWIYLLLTTLIFIAVAVVYLKISSKTFRVSTKILINIDNSGQRSGNSDLLDVGELMSQNKSLQNELVYIGSTPLIKEVIDEMNLVTSYYMQEGRIPIPRELMFTLTDIYEQSPFIVVLDENHPQPINTMIYIGIRDDRTFAIAGFNQETTLFDFKNESTIQTGVDFNISGIYSFGATVENDHCSFKILLNSNFNPEQFLGKELFFEFNSPSSLAAKFRNSLYIQLSDRESGMVDLSLRWSNPNLASELLENLVGKYIDKDLQAKNRLANSTIEYIDKQLSNISGTLGRSEQQLQNFRSSYDVMSIDEKTRNLSRQITDLESRRDDLSSDLRSLRQIENYFETNKDESNFAAPSLFGFEDEVLSTLIQEMARLASEKQELINRNQIKSPRLKILDQNIDNIKRVISENLTLLINSASSDLGAVNDRLSELNREYGQLPQTQRRLQGLERDFNITDAAYTTLLNKRIEAQIARASNEPDCEVIEPIKFNGVVAPNIKAVLALAIALGLMLPMLIILASYFLTDKIKNLDEIKRYVPLKAAGSIPRVEGKIENVILDSPHSPISEAFFSLKSNLVYYMMGKTNKTILVTSSIPNEGKSFTSLNLAASFATTHNKTLLISYDMRKGNKVFRELRAQSSPGISEFLINHAGLDEIVQKDTGVPNLHFIDNGEIPPDPVVLISSPNTEQLFEQLKSTYDYIIVDSPPYDVFTDAFLLMKFADISLFVSRMGVVTRKALRNCITDMKQKNIENVFSMINDIRHINDSKYSYYREKKQKKGFFRRIFRQKKKRS